MPVSKERTAIKVQAERAILAACRLPNSNHDPESPFGELKALAEQAGAVVVGELEQHRQTPEPGSFLGKGKLEELKGLCERLDAQTVIFDHELSPKQIANIEKVVQRKILDRSELILDIFAGRATTHEAKLQVELAQLEYTYPRLRSMWSHLERIGGSGGMGGVGTRGPGEQQLEIDRRLAQNKKVALQRELGAIQARKRREVEARKAENFTVGLVGYTNAGKSTLFNTLTEGGAYADDRLFATLMTRTRKWDLGSGTGVMLSDTVGFVRDLPHHLVASFRATLDEVVHADLLLIVLDIASPGAELRYKTVMDTLDEIIEDFAGGGETVVEGEGWSKRESVRVPERVVLLNKVDRLQSPSELLVWQAKPFETIPICALAPEQGGTGLGLEELRARVRLSLLGREREVRVTLPISASKAIHQIETQGAVLGREYNGQAVTLHARLGHRQIEPLRMTPGVVIEEA